MSHNGPCFICGSLHLCSHREPELLPEKQRRRFARRFVAKETGLPQGTVKIPPQMTPELELRRHAYNQVATALRTGQLRRPVLCSLCGVSCKPEAHHEDYNQPLKVVWTCRPCHRKLDAMSLVERMGVENLLRKKAKAC